MATFSSSSPLPMPLLVLLVSSLAFLHPITQVQSSAPPVVKGLSYKFYRSSCPKLESVVRNYLTVAFNRDIGLAAGLLRLQFHDCFVQSHGCDASLLLNGSTSEQQAIPNLTLRPEALQTINDLRTLIDNTCGQQLVSCADIITLAARDSVYLSGGPDFCVPLGRRDSLSFATPNETRADIPAPFFNVTNLLAVFHNLSLSATDLVSLSGAHTIGLSHCPALTNRLYPTVDPTMDQTFAANLRRTCPTTNATNTTVLDVRSPDAFDNRYYVNLMNRMGLFTSDQDLYTDSRTRAIVRSFALDQVLFFENFAYSLVKMGQLNVLTGTQGEVRTNCSVINSECPAEL